MRISIPVILLLFLCACSIKPTPDQSTGLYTKAIVNHVRCEAQRAIQDQAINLLAGNREEALAARLRAGGTREFADDVGLIDRLDAKLRRQFRRYLDVGIAYEFTLDVTEDDDDRFAIDLLRPVAGGAASLGLRAGVERVRQNVRIFTVTDTFRGLATNPEVCEHPPIGFDLVYPMRGHILVAETINNFIDLNELAGGPLTRKSKDDAQVYSDQFHFRTIVTASAVPGGNLTPARFGPKDLSLTAAATRTDDHKVIIGISLPTEAKVPAGSTTVPLVGTIGAATIPTDRTGAVQRAVLAIQEAKVNVFLNNFNFALTVR